MANISENSKTVLDKFSDLRIKSFCQFDSDSKKEEIYLSFATHVAVLWIFDAQMLYAMRSVFKYDDHTLFPREIVSDMLLSPLCSHIGYKWYQVEANVRRRLLGSRLEGPLLDRERMHRIANFQLTYFNFHISRDIKEIFAENMLLNATSIFTPDRAVKYLLNQSKVAEGAMPREYYCDLPTQLPLDGIIKPVGYEEIFKAFRVLQLEGKGEITHAFELSDTIDYTNNEISRLEIKQNTQEIEDSAKIGIEEGEDRYEITIFYSMVLKKGKKTFAKKEIIEWYREQIQQKGIKDVMLEIDSYEAVFLSNLLEKPIAFSIRKILVENKG